MGFDQVELTALRDLVVEVTPFEVLHHHEGDAAREGPHVEDAADVVGLDACRRALGEVAFAEHASGGSAADADGEGWRVLLAVGDAFVFEGSSDTGLAELAATGKPVFVVREVEPPSARGPSERARRRIVDTIIARARAKPANDRGTTRPQEGLEWLCARLVAEGYVRPRPDRDPMRASLLAAGHVRMLSAVLTPADLAGFPPPPPSELERVAARVRAMLGLQPSSR